MTADVEPRRRRAQHNAILAALSEIAGKLTTLAWMIVAARVLSQADFGAFSLALAIALMISAVAEWGFDPMLIVRGSQDRRGLPRLHSLTLAWETAIGVPVFLVAGLVVWFARPPDDPRGVMLLVLLAVFLDLWSDTARASSAAAQDQAGTAVAMSIQRLTAAVLIIPALALGLGLPGMAAAFLAASVVGWVTHVVALRRLDVRFRLSLVDREGMRTFARGTAMVGLGGLILMVLFRVDALLLAWLQGDEAVGEYAAAYRLFETVLFVTYAVTGAVAPLVAARIADRDAVKRTATTAAALLCAGYVAFSAICVSEAEALLELLYGERYVGAAGALQWLAVAPVAYGISAVAGMVLVSAERSAGMLVGAAVALVVNVGLNLALIPELSGTGAGLATAIAYAVDAAIALWFVRAVAGRLSLTAMLGEALVAGAAMAGVLIALPLPLLAEVPIGLAVYAVTWFALVSWRRPELVSALRAAAPRLLPGA